MTDFYAILKERRKLNQSLVTLSSCNIKRVLLSCIQDYGVFRITVQGDKGFYLLVFKLIHK